MEDKKFIAIVCGECEEEETEKMIGRIGKEFNGLLFLFSDTERHPANQKRQAKALAEHIIKRKVDAVVTVNSFLFFEAFLFYLKKNEANADIKYYLLDCFGNLDSFSDNPNDIMKSLSQPTFDLADEKFQYELETGNLEIGV